VQEEECVSQHLDLPADADAVTKDAQPLASQQDPPQQQHILEDHPQQLEEQEQLLQQQQKPATLQPRENTLENVAKIVRVR
jgi:hypothetical protein